MAISQRALATNLFILMPEIGLLSAKAEKGDLEIPGFSFLQF
jgi:hypothetical protein